jgi:hypothetical protein
MSSAHPPLGDVTGSVEAENTFASVRSPFGGRAS